MLDLPRLNVLPRANQMPGDVRYEPRSLLFVHHAIQQTRLLEIIRPVRFRILCPAR